MQIRGWQLLTLLHATVDALCACCVYLLAQKVQAESVFMVFVIYNCVAFISQAFTGLWIDRTGVRSGSFILSVALLSVGASLCLCDICLDIVVPPLLTAAVIGLGNSLFHVFGGKYVTIYSRNDMRHLGVFVSTGALGLMLGGKYSSILGLTTILGIMLLLSFVFLLQIRKPSEQCVQYGILPAASYSSEIRYGVFLFIFVLLIVAFRSFLGKMIPLSLNTLQWYPLAACLLAVSGKASGGFVAERVGEGTTLMVTLLVAGCCFLLGSYSDAFMLPMIFFINLSMPVTLHLANRCCPGHEGFAFGMIAAMLIPGYALGMVSVENPFAYHLLYPLISTLLIEISVLLLLKERRWKVLMMAVVMNILTNVPLNIYAWYSYGAMTYKSIIMLESGVVLIETILYYIVTHDIRKSLLYAVLCNAISYLIGLLFLTYLR